MGEGNVTPCWREGGVVSSHVWDLVKLICLQEILTTASPPPLHTILSSPEELVPCEPLLLIIGVSYPLGQEIGWEPLPQWVYGPPCLCDLPCCWEGSWLCPEESGLCGRQAHLLTLLPQLHMHRAHTHTAYLRKLANALRAPTARNALEIPKRSTEQTRRATLSALRIARAL